MPKHSIVYYTLYISDCLVLVNQCFFTIIKIFFNFGIQLVWKYISLLNIVNLKQFIVSYDEGIPNKFQEIHACKLF